MKFLNTMRSCQYCGTDVYRASAIPFATCERCKKQRAMIMREFRFRYKTFWVCKCKKPRSIKESYCGECLAFKTDSKKAYEKRT